MKHSKLAGLLIISLLMAGMPPIWVFAGSTTLAPNTFTISGGGIATTATQVTHTYDRVQQSFLYKDYGAGFFTPSQNFTLDFAVKDSSATAYRMWCPFSMTNDLDGYYQTSGYQLGVEMHWGSGEYDVFIRLIERNDGALSVWDTNTDTLVQDTFYYLSYYEESGTAYLDVYSNSARTNKILELSIALNNPSYSYRYLMLAQSSEQGVGSDNALAYSKDYVMGLVTQTYIEDVTETDLMLWTEIQYASNSTGSHKLEYDDNADFSSIIDTLWDNSTQDPQFFIPQSDYGVNQTIYYRMTVPDGYSETGDFGYFESANDPADVKVKFPDQQIIGGGNTDPPNMVLPRFVWVDPVSGEWTTKTGGGDSTLIRQSPDRGLTWTTIDTLSFNTDLPSGWSDQGSWGGFVYNGTHYILILGGADATDRGSFIYYGTALDSLSYHGVLVDSNSGYTGLSKNARCRGGWWNETDSHFYFGIGGATDTFGAWDFVYKVCDTDDDLTIVDEVASSPTTLIYEETDWGDSAWVGGTGTNGFVYPFQQPLWDWTNNRGMATVCGCGKDQEDYDFDVDLAFPPSPIPTGNEYFYMANTSAKGYYGQFFDTGQYKSVGMTDIYDTCLIWENNGAMFSKMTESQTAGVSDPDAGDIWLGCVRGFYNDTMIGVEQGYARVTRYYELPTRTQFVDQMLSLNLWTTENLNATIDYIDGTSPTYCEFKIYDTDDDANITMSIKNMGAGTRYLHQTNETGYYDYQITDSATGAIATLTPAGDGNDFMFTFTQTGSSPPPTTPNNLNIGHNETRINQLCKFYSEWNQTGTANLTYSVLEWDITGSYTQVANLSLAGLSTGWANSTQTLPTNRSSINYRFTTFNTDGLNTTASNLLTIQPASGDLSDWSYYRESNLWGGGDALTDYPIPITVLYSNNVFDTLINLGGYNGSIVFNISDFTNAVTSIKETSNVIITDQGGGSYLYEKWVTGEGDCGIYYLTSTDGLTYSEGYSTHVIEGTVYEDPWVIKENGEYVMLAENNTGSTNNIVRFESHDGINWTNSSTVLDKGSGGSWDDWQVSSPTIYVEGSTWYMLYEGQIQSDIGAIGLATSIDDGKNWSKSESNPVFDPVQGDVDFYWASNVTVPTSIIKIDNTWYLTYGGTSFNSTESSATGGTSHWLQGIASGIELENLTGSMAYLYLDKLSLPLFATETSLYYDEKHAEYLAHIIVNDEGIYLGYPNSNSYALTNGNCQPDFDDIRFTDGDDVLLDYYLLEKIDGEYALFEVKYPQILAYGSKTIRCYYGNPSASTLSEGTDVYTKFDDFEGDSINTTFWTVSNVDCTVDVTTDEAISGSQSVIINGTHNTIADDPQYAAMSWIDKLSHGSRRISFWIKTPPIIYSTREVNWYYDANLGWKYWVNSEEDSDKWTWRSSQVEPDQLLDLIDVEFNSWYKFELVFDDTDADLEALTIKKERWYPVCLGANLDEHIATSNALLNSFYSAGADYNAFYVDEYIYRKWSPNEPTLDGFSEPISLNTAPTATALEITNPSDGIYIIAGSGIGYTFRMVGTDVDGGSDISSLHGSLVFDEHFRLNVSLSGATVSFPEGGDYVVYGGDTITILGNTTRVDVVLAFTEQTPSVNNIDGYLQVTDSSSASSGWTKFDEIITTMLYSDDGGGGGGGGTAPSPITPPSLNGEAEPQAPDTFIVITHEPETFSEEYLIEVRNPITNQYINIMPIPWGWTSAQKIVVIWFLGVIILLLISAIFKTVKERKKQKRREEYINPLLKIRY